MRTWPSSEAPSLRLRAENSAAGGHTFQWVEERSGCSQPRVHHPTGPAIGRVHPNGARYLQWMRNGVAHRDNGPAGVWWNPNGSLHLTWVRHETSSRLDGPCEVLADGNIRWTDQFGHLVVDVAQRSRVDRP